MEKNCGRTINGGLLLITNSTHSTCGVSCTVSVWRGVHGYLKFLAVAIAKFRSQGKNMRKKQHARLIIIIDSLGLLLITGYGPEKD